MIFETIEAEGLAHLSYFVGDASAGVAVVIDPKRDVQDYLDLAQRHGVRIVRILETHVHADFVSGSLELAAKTGAVVHVGAADGYGFEHAALSDGDVLEVGGLSFEALHTPGHTPEHMGFLVSGGKGSSKPWALFSGDALFAGEVGRPDLLGEEEKLALARALYRSLHGKILVLDDGVEVFPAHGEGSPCGGSIGDRRTTTVGYERKYNPKLQPMGEAEFVRLVLADLPPAPAYYPRTKGVNLRGPTVSGGMAIVPALSPQEVLERSREPGVRIVDAREIEAFGGGHVPGSLSIPLRGEFPVWCGWMLDPEHRIVLVLPDESKLREVRTHLFRIGIDRVDGYLASGMRGWFEAGLEFSKDEQMSVFELHGSLGRMQVLDVRTEGEWLAGHVPTAVHLFVPRIEEGLGTTLDRGEPVAVYCGSGYRASIAASVLQRMGFRDVRNVPGSMRAWKSAGLAVEVPTVRGPGA